MNSENQQTGILTVSANKLIFAPGETIVFSGQVTQNGSPVSGVRIAAADPIHQVSQDVGSTDPLGNFSYSVSIPLQLSGRRITGIYTFTFSIPSIPGLKKYVTLSVRDKNEAPEAFTMKRPDISLTLGSADTLTGNTLALASNVAGTTPQVASNDIIAVNRVLLDGGKECLHDFFTDPVTDVAIGVALASCPVPGPQTALCVMTVSYIKLQAAETIAKVGMPEFLRQLLESFYSADADKKKALESLLKSANLGISIVTFDSRGGLVGFLSDGLLPLLRLEYQILDLETEILERDGSDQPLRAKMVLQPADPTKPVLGISLRRKPPTGLWQRVLSFLHLQPSLDAQMGMRQVNAVADQSISWQGLGGLTLSRPEAVIDRLGTVYLIVRGADNGLYLNTERQGAWLGWVAILGGGATSGGPAAVIDADGVTLHLFVRGLDDHLYENVLVGTQWTGWSQILGGGLTPSSPTAAIDPNWTIYLFVRGLDNAIWYTAKAGGT
ncbi:MAG: hypothetical protein KGL32_06775 [candidate division NC10 bacterium]|nr:hypothetical protein [candidate division NC10 bacterium]